MVAPIDINALRAERKRRVGHDMLNHFRSEIHDYAKQSYLPRGDAADLTVENIKQRIRVAKAKKNPND